MSLTFHSFVPKTILCVSCKPSGVLDTTHMRTTEAKSE
jgi:hypothetical protein